MVVRTNLVSYVFTDACFQDLVLFVVIQKNTVMKAQMITGR